MARHLSLHSAQRYIKTTKASQRTPWRSRLKRKQIAKKSAEEKKTLAEKRLKKKIDYQTALAEAQDVLMQEAVKMHETLGCHTVDYYYEAIIQTSHMTKHQRACNPWNAYLRAEVKKYNEGMFYKDDIIFFLTCIPKHCPTMSLVAKLQN
jgi:hypothetical protein